MVATQVQQHNMSLRSCQRCGKAFRTKGDYHSMLRSVFGNVAMRVRRLRGCSCTGTQDRSYSALFTNRNPITPELKYLTAKRAALLPFGKVTDFLSERFCWGNAWLTLDHTAAPSERYWCGRPPNPARAASFRAVDSST